MRKRIGRCALVLIAVSGLFGSCLLGCARKEPPPPASGDAVGSPGTFGGRPKAN